MWLNSTLDVPLVLLQRIWTWPELKTRSSDSPRQLLLLAEPTPLPCRSSGTRSYKRSSTAEEYIFCATTIVLRKYNEWIQMQGQKFYRRHEPWPATPELLLNPACSRNLDGAAGIRMNYICECSSPRNQFPSRKRLLPLFYKSFGYLERFRSIPLHTSSLPRKSRTPQRWPASSIL